MFIHYDTTTEKLTPYNSMPDIARNTDITIAQLKYQFSILKKSEWKTDNFIISKSDIVSMKKKPRGKSKYGFE